MMGYGWSWPGMMYGWGGGFGLIGFLLTIIFWIFFIALIVKIARCHGGYTNQPESKTTPLDILKERYAKGELTKKQFEEMKKDLG